MIDSFKYINHIGEELKVGKDSVLFAEPNDIRDFVMDYESTQKRIHKFSQGIITKNLPLKIIIHTAAFDLGLTAESVMTWLGEFIAKDIDSMNYGKLIIGNYYLKCYISGIKHKKYHLSNRHAEVELTIVTDKPKWIKESAYEFLPKDHVAEKKDGKKNLDFSYDFNYDYFGDFSTKRIDIENLSGADFKMTIFGKANNPSVRIGDHLYQVNTLVEIGDFLVIDSFEKTIDLHRSDGEIMNCFFQRYKESYIFERIKQGVNQLVWDGNFGINLIVFDERNTPGWI